MRRSLLPLTACALFLCGCASEPKPAPAPVAKTKPRPFDETRNFPMDGRAGVKVVDDNLLGHPFLPGGNIAHYRKGKQEYDLILIRTPDANSAALLLFDFKKQLKEPKVIAHFGGFFGQDGGRHAFLFAKSQYLAGVLGLPEAEADTVARDFAARLR